MLRLLALLARSPGGVRAGEASRDLGKSLSATYELLDALCSEGFAIHTERGAYRLADPANAAIAAQGGTPVPLITFEGVLDEVFARTHKRAYLAVARQGRLVIPLERGRQGIRRMPGLRTAIRGNAHALALGKVALSLLDGPALERYASADLTRFTEHTVTERAVLLAAQLDDVRRTGIATDREEFEEDFCCLAVRGSGPPPAAVRRARDLDVRVRVRHGARRARGGPARGGRARRARPRRRPVPALPEEREVS